MKKFVIFNVGGALSCYLEYEDKKIIIDLGSSGDFSPVEDFLIPLAEKMEFIKHEDNGKYLLDQLFISHLDKDHIADYEKFDENFHSTRMTCPNNNQSQDDDFKINKELLGEQSDLRDLILSEMRTRSPWLKEEPLRSLCEDVRLFFIKPAECEDNEDLKEGYANNISLVLLIQFENKNILLPGDMLKNGMDYILNSSEELRDILNEDGIDYLIAPHHGLETSFPEILFQEIKGNKTRLNIISEKLREKESEENRSDVDSRYYSSNYSTGENSLEQNAVKTSGGHIIIDFETEEEAVRVVDDTEELINEFSRQ